MLPDWVSNPGPLTYESGALPCLRVPETKVAELTNREDLDEVAHNEPPHLDLHSCPLVYVFSISYSLN